MTYLFKPYDGEIKNDSGNPIRVTSLADKPYNVDAYGRPKAVHDYSIFTGEGTLRLPKRVWEQQDFNLSTNPATVTHKSVDGVHTLSEDHMLTVKSGTVLNRGYALKTKAFFRVQSNRGALYSWSAEYPNPSAHGNRAIGPSSGENGISLFMVGSGTGWTLYYSRRASNVVAAMVDITPLLPSGFDPSRGHLYDLRIQWRGVGNIQVFIDGELIYTEQLLNSVTGLNVTDNAMPFVVASSCAETGVEVACKVGCVDVTSEGGHIQSTVFGSISTGDTPVQVDTTGTPTLALYVPRFITYNGGMMYNTRGAIMTKAVQWLRDEGACIAYVVSDYDAPNLSNTAWSAVGDSNLLHAIGGDASALNTSFLLDKANCSEVVREYSEIETKNIITNPGNDDFMVSPGQMLILVAKPLANNKQAFVTLYYSEEL
jgi:hypothetical protein